VGVEAVQAVYAGAAYYKTEEAWVMTPSSFFTLGAKELAKIIGVKLIDGFELQREWLVGMDHLLH
jgi:HJR/Mrr/RecB family endonuclease